MPRRLRTAIPLPLTKTYFFFLPEPAAAPNSRAQSVARFASYDTERIKALVMDGLPQSLRWHHQFSPALKSGSLRVLSLFIAVHQKFKQGDWLTVLVADWQKQANGQVNGSRIFDLAFLPRK